MKSKATKKKQKAKATRRPADLHTIGVRFADGQNLQRVYTYVVPKRANVLLGEELIADSPRGPAVVFVVRKDSTVVRPADFDGELKRITRRVRPL